jgi:hypothetical protein
VELVMFVLVTLLAGVCKEIRAGGRARAFRQRARAFSLTAALVELAVWCIYPYLLHLVVRPWLAWAAILIAFGFALTLALGSAPSPRSASNVRAKQLQRDDAAHAE